MNKLYKSNTILIIVFLVSINNLFANGDDDKLKEKNNIKSPQNMTIGMSSSMQLQLNSAISKLEQQLVANDAFVNGLSDKMVDVREVLSAAVADDRTQASKVMSYLDSNPDKVKTIQSLNFADLTTLPIGLSAKAGDNTQILLGILEAQFKEGYAELTVFMRVKFVLDGTDRDLFFGVDQLKFTRKGFVDGGGFRAVLLGNYVIPAKKWTVVLTGGSGVGDRTYDATRTYIDFTCNDFNEVSLAAEVIFPRSVLVPYDPLKGKANPTGRVSFKLVSLVDANKNASFTKATGARGLLVSVTATGPNNGAFCIPSFESLVLK